MPAALMTTISKHVAAFKLPRRPSCLDGRNHHLESEFDRSLEMEDVPDLKYDVTMETMEIIPPAREAASCAGAVACLCCGCFRTSEDEDCYGICEECLAP